MNTGRSELSEGEFRKDVAIDPELADNYFQLAQLYAQQQRDAEAESLFREALKARSAPLRRLVWPCQALSEAREAGPGSASDRRGRETCAEK